MSVRMSMSLEKVDEPKSSILMVAFAFLLEVLRNSSIVSLTSFAASSFLSLSCRSSGDSFGEGCRAVVRGSSDGKENTMAGSWACDICGSFIEG